MPQVLQLTTAILLVSSAPFGWPTIAAGGTTSLWRTPRGGAITSSRQGRLGGGACRWGRRWVGGGQGGPVGRGRAGPRGRGRGWRRGQR